MRVIAGKAKGRRLMMVPGDGTRPITDRAKEALFSIMGTWIEGTRVLALFGGTGGVGIESLSRGADFVHFVELNRKAVETIDANLRHCGFEKWAAIERGDSFTYLQRYQGRPYDLIYVAPPQYQGFWLKTLQIVDARPALLAKFGSVIVQIHPREDIPVVLERLEEYDRRRYGSVMLIFYMTTEDLAEADEERDGRVNGEEQDAEAVWDDHFEMDDEVENRV